MYRTCNGVWAYTDPSTRNQIYPRTSPYAFLWPHVPHKYEEDAVISAHRHGWCHVIDAAMTCLRSPPQVGTCSEGVKQRRQANDGDGGGFTVVFLSRRGTVFVPEIRNTAERRARVGF
ncbi:hypothetical protein E3N88_12331 [Mikania micrantha]|uniref:Uncharacterized protein n=1 Tax=Mikania micrantha TaxID=192012 RepID=A0A5N6P5I8_9ASTR|nr:hypothetical protein E3N88_12331 [Mikania micrantha]